MDTTLASSNGEDLSEVHAKLVRKATEDSTETSGWRSLANFFTTRKSSGETTTRKIDGTRNTTAESNIDTAGALSGEEAPAQKSDYTDKVTVFTWDFDITSLQEYKKNNRTETSTLTENSDENSSSNGIVVTLDVDNRSRSVVGDEVTIAIDTVDSTDTQTNTTTPGDDSTEEKLKITSDKTTTHSTEVQNGWNTESTSVSFGSIYPSNAGGTINLLLNNYTNTTKTVEKSNYDSTHKIDEAGQVSNGEFSADSTYEISKSFEGNREDPPLTPSTPIDGSLSLEYHEFNFLTTQLHKADEKGSYSGSGNDRIMKGSYAETITNEENDNAQKTSIDVNSMGAGITYSEATDETTIIFNLTNKGKKTQQFKGAYGPEGQTKKLIVDTQKVLTKAVEELTEDIYESGQGDEGIWTKRISTWVLQNVVPNEGTPHGEETTYVVRTSTDEAYYSVYDLTLVTIDGTQYAEQVGSLYTVEGFTLKDDLYDENAPLVAKRVVVTLAAIEAGMIQPANHDSWWWAGTNTLLIEGQLVLWGMQDSEYYDDSVKILQGEALYFLDTVTLGHAETGDYAQQLFDEAGIDRDLQMAPKAVANAGAAVTWLIGGGLLIEAAGATAAGEGVVVYVGSSVSPAVLATTGDALVLLGTAYSTKSAIDNILSGQYDELAFDLAGYTASRAVGRQISKQFARPMTVEAPKVIPSRPPKTVYHQGDLTGGISDSRPLSTSPVKELGHYHPDGDLYQFDIPADVYDQWILDRSIQPFNDLHLPSGSIRPEIRIMPPASGQMNDFLVPHRGG